MRVITFAAVALALAACSSSSNTVTSQPQPAKVVEPPKPKVLDPVGVYDFTTTTPDAQSVTGTMTILGPAPTYTGKIITNVFPEIAVVGAEVRGDTVDVKASMPDGTLAIRLVMKGNDFTGQWTLGADSGPFNGKKQPKL